MFQRLLLINLALAAMLSAGVIKLRRDARAFSTSHRLDRIRPEQGKPLPKPVSGVGARPAQEWPDIAAHNPFSFDRSDVTLVVTPPGPSQPKRPKPILFGTITLGPEKLAMLGPGDGATRSSRPVKAGEVFDGWKIIEIEDKSVTVQSDDIRESVIMNDPTAQVQRDYSKTTAAVAPPSAVAIGAPAANARPAAAAPSAQPSAPPPPSSAGGKRQIVVQTPFGPKVMDDPSQ